MSIISALVILSSLRYGVCKMEGMIIKGAKAKIDDFPHSVYLVIGTKWGAVACGSSLLNQRVLITAAHCMENCDKCLTMASLGSADIHGGHLVKVIDQYAHEDWDRTMFTNDIALLYLSESVSFNSSIKRVAIMKDPPADTTVQVAGWGVVEGKNGGLENTLVLQYTDFVLASEKECDDFLNSPVPKTFCANGVRSSDVSSGDSGGGLIARKYILIGIVSFGIPNRSQTMAAYTKVSDFYDWIKLYTKVLYCNNDGDKKSRKKGL